MKLTFNDLAAGSDIHVARCIDGQSFEITPTPDAEEEFDKLIGHLFDDPARSYAIFPRLGDNKLYASAEIMRTN